MATSCLCRIEGTQLILASPIPVPNFEGLEIVAPNMLIKFLSLADLHFHCLVFFNYVKEKNMWLGIRWSCCARVSLRNVDYCM